MKSLITGKYKFKKCIPEQNCVNTKMWGGNFMTQFVQTILYQNPWGFSFDTGSSIGSIAYGAISYRKRN